MTQFPHDQFAKDLFEVLLSPFGTVETDRTITSEVRAIDIYFTPRNMPLTFPSLGLLLRCAQTGAAFEAFRSPVQDDEIRSTMGKLFNLHEELTRQAKRDQQLPPKTDVLPRLWIITPTLSQEKLRELNVITKEEEWGKGVYLLGNILKTGIIVIHQLPKTPETLWFRVLGRGKVQQNAIDEIAALPANSPYRGDVLELFSTLKVILESRANREPDETELLMKLTQSPLFVEYMERATNEARSQGLETGRETGKETERQSIVENLLIVRFGTLDSDLAGIVPNIIQLSPPEFTPLLLNLSQAELIERFKLI
jgi:hypothetical protein